MLQFLCLRLDCLDYIVVATHKNVLKTSLFLHLEWNEEIKVAKCNFLQPDLSC